MSVYPSVGRDWKHELAAFRCRMAQRCPLAGLPGPRWNHLMAETASLEASIGRDRGKLLRLQLTACSELWTGNAPTSLRVKERSRESPDCTTICVRSDLAIAIKQLAIMAVKSMRFCTVRNQPMAASLWSITWPKRPSDGWSDRWRRTGYSWLGFWRPVWG